MHRKCVRMNEYLENIVVDVCFSFLNQLDFFPNGDEGITEPVQLSLRFNDKGKESGIRISFEENVNLRML